MGEALDSELTAWLRMLPRGSNSTLAANPIIARHILEDDLGRFAEGPTPYQLDQQTRDILLAHARQDAAEALLNTKALLEEMRGLTNAWRTQTTELRWGVLSLFAIYFFWAWWKSGFTLPWQ
jgi:hypothetical protein